MVLLLLDLKHKYSTGIANITILLTFKAIHTQLSVTSEAKCCYNVTVLNR